MNNSLADANIPVLTEIIAPAEMNSPASVKPTLVQSGRADLETISEEASQTWNGIDWDTFERKMNQRILRQLQGRIDFVLEHRIRDSLADVLQTAIEGLTQEIKRGLHQTLEETISRAISQELARLQTAKK